MFAGSRIEAQSGLKDRAPGKCPSSTLAGPSTQTEIAAHATRWIRRAVLKYEWLFVFQILEIVAHFFDPFAVRGGIAVRKKMRIAVVSVLNSSRVVDRAPVLLGTSRDFDDIVDAG